MVLELIIKGVLIESIEFDFTHIGNSTFYDREEIITNYRNYFKRKYFPDLMLTKEWVIQLFVSSKINLLTCNFDSDEEYIEAIEQILFNQ